MGPDDFPYDPKAWPPESLVGLEKLRAVPDHTPTDKAIRQFLWDLYETAQRNERDPAFCARERADRERKRREDQRLDDLMCDRALAGEYGSEAKTVAHEILGRGRGPESVVALRKALQELRRVA